MNKKPSQKFCVIKFHSVYLSDDAVIKSSIIRDTHSEIFSDDGFTNLVCFMTGSTIYSHLGAVKSAKEKSDLVT